MDRLLKRSKSQKFKPSRREQFAELDLTQSTSSTSESIESWNSRNVMVMRTAAAGAGQWVDLVDDPPRPKTSDGSRSTAKRMMAVGEPIVITADDETFHFPTPTPRRTQFSPLTPVSGARSEPEDMGIGVALGSPSHARQFRSMTTGTDSPLRNQQFLDTGSKEALSSAWSHDTFSPGRSPNVQRDITELSKPKLSRWRSLGSFFGKKGLQQQNDQSLKDQPQTEQPPLRRPDLKVEEFNKDAPVVYVSDGTEPPKEIKKSKGKKKAAKAQALPPEDDTSPAALPNGPLLDINIPDIHMERYSVMFSSVLPERHGRHGRQPSLLARRQGGKASHLEPLQIPNAPGLRRRATSPAASPSFSLFPPRDSSKDNVGRASSVLTRPRPLRRTKTAPALSPRFEVAEPLSATTQGDEMSIEEKSRQALTPTPSEPSSPSTPKDGEVANMNVRARANTNPTNKWKYSIMDADADADINTAEPAWEMITIGKRAEPGDRISPSTSTVSFSRPMAHAPSPLSQIRNHAHAPRQDPKHDTIYNAIAELEDDWNQYRGEVQVARSLSVTKAKKQLFLKPAAMRDAREGSGTKDRGRDGDGGTLGVGGARLVERTLNVPVNESRALTPTLVETRERKSMAVSILDA